MEITKLKMKTDATGVEYETLNITTPERHALENCGDGRRASFEEARVAVELDVIELLGIGKKLGERYRLTQVSVSKNAHRHRGFIFHGMFRTNVGEVSLQTPLMREPIDGGEGGSNTLTDVAFKRLRDLLEEGVAYAAGQREQTELPLGAAAEG